MPGSFRYYKDKYQRRLLLLLFFLIVSFILWFIRALNENYEADINYPVKYTQLPKNKILDGNQPKSLKLRVQATGLTILTRQLRINMSALRFNVESFSMVDSGKNSFYILTSQVREYVEGDLEGIRIIDISPDSIHFRFVDVVSYKKPVNVTLKDPSKLLAKQYLLNGNIHTIPDSVVVTGPSSILDSLLYLNTFPLDLKNLDDSVIKSVAIQPLDQLEISHQKVKVVIPVDKYTESLVSLPVVAMNVPDSVNLKTFPSAVNVTYSITLSNYEKISPQMLMPYVNYFNIKSGEKLTVALTDTPQWINNVRISPEKVDYIIEK